MTSPICRRALSLALLFFSSAASFLSAQSPPVFSQVIVFGDSLSDDGNIKHVIEDKFFIAYPSVVFNYADGRFTNSNETSPASTLYAGVWHEQLAQTFLGLPAASNSLDGGLDYAFGGATTVDGTSERTVISNIAPFLGGELSITIDNIGLQVDNYLASHTSIPRRSTSFGAVATISSMTTARRT